MDTLITYYSRLIIQKDKINDIDILKKNCSYVWKIYDHLKISSLMSFNSEVRNFRAKQAKTGKNIAAYLL
jgi:hypothetical protein